MGSLLGVWVLAMIGVFLIATEGYAGQVTLAWDGSSSAGVTGYRVHYGQASGNYTSNADAGNNLSYTVSNLQEGKIYFFAVAAYGGGSESPPSNEVSATVAVATTAPVANFTATPTSGPAPLTVNFTDTSTGDITNWSWNFGDGGTSTGQTAIKTYANSGTYTVSLTVSGPGGDNTATKSNLISVGAAPSAPVANFTADQTTGAPPLSVKFTDTSTGDITNWSWNFGDGGTSTRRNPYHSYATAGTYTVALTVTGPGGSNTKTQTDYISIAAAGGAPPPPGPNPNPDPTSSAVGLVAAYGFEELTGNEVDDASGQGNNGIISGATRTDHGKFGKALSFDGANDWVTIKDADSLDLTTGMTLEAWVYPTAAESHSDRWHPVLTKEPSSKGSPPVYYMASNRYLDKLEVTISTNNLHSLQNGRSLVPETWTHIASSYDGSMLRLYVNGKAIADQSLSGDIQITAGPLLIGSSSVWGEFFQGYIDEVRIYDRALTAMEIQTDMATPVLP